MYKKLKYLFILLFIYFSDILSAYQISIYHLAPFKKKKEKSTVAL